MRQRRGLTLIELLVVIGIIVMLLAIAIPVMKTVTVGKKIRDGSRMLNAYFTSIQGYGAERQRSQGIWIERSDVNSGMATTIFRAEVPPPYAGDLIGATAVIKPGATIPAVPGPTSPPAKPAITTGIAEFTDGFSTSLPNLVEPGDFIRLGLNGPYYRIRAVQTAPVLRVIFDYNDPFFRDGNSANPSYYNGVPPRSPFSGSVPYQILRRPKRSMAGSIELPKTVVLDLTWSGAGNSGIEFNPVSATDNSPIVIMFSPMGRVDLVYVQNTALRPQAPIHLLIGRDDQMDADLIALDPDKTDNLGDAEAIWMSIGHMTGSVTTAPNQAPTSPGPPANVVEARAEARRAHIMRGAS